MISIPAILILPATLATGVPVDCSALHARADALYSDRHFAEAAGAYRDYVQRCPCLSAPTSGAIPPSAEAVSPGPGVSEPKLLKLGLLPKLPRPTIVLVLITKTGRVADNRILTSSRDTAADGLVQSAIKNALFEPATKDGVPVPMWKTLTVPSLNE